MFLKVTQGRSQSVADLGMLSMFGLAVPPLGDSE